MDEISEDEFELLGFFVVRLYSKTNSNSLISLRQHYIQKLATQK